MKKFSLSLLAAGVMAVASVAHADAIFYPDGTSIDLGEGGAEALALACSTGDTSCLHSSMMASSGLDTSVLGAAPAASKSVSTKQYVYVQPNINWDRSTAMRQMHSNVHLMNRHHMDRSAAATFNTPTRAGEASTMTGGAPNAMTTNDRMIVGSYSIPHTSVTPPYYVFSY